MSSQIDRLIGSNVPWQFRLMVILVFALVAGGLFLDQQAANVSLPDFSKVAEQRVDAETGQEIKIIKEYTDEDRKMIAEITKEKSASLSDSAKMLYDFAKVALGALLASLTNVITKAKDDNDLSNDAE